MTFKTLTIHCSGCGGDYQINVYNKPTKKESETMGNCLDAWDKKQCPYCHKEYNKKEDKTVSTSDKITYKIITKKG